MLIDGQNSAGLSISGNYLPGFTTYQTVTKDDTKYAAITESTAFILSQFATVKEAKQALSQYKVWSDKSTMVDGVNPEIHFLITDKSGHGLVVEYINGEAKFYDVNSNIKVMTNGPTYDWQLTNLRNYLNLSNKTIDLIKLDDVESNETKTIKDVNGVGQGNGFLGLPGDYSPPSRFVKMATLAYYSSSAVMPTKRKYSI